MAEEATQTAVETNNGTQTVPQNTPSAEDNKTTATSGTQTAPEQNKEPQETKPTETNEPALTIESYGNLGIVETEEVKMNPELLGEFKKLALAEGIKPEIANKIAKLQFDSLQKEASMYKELQKKWDEENSKTYGDNLKNVETNVGRVLAEFDKEGKFKQLLTLAGAEKAPATLAFLKSIGDKVLEKGSVNPNTNSVIAEEKELADYYNN